MDPVYTVCYRDFLMGPADEDGHSDALVCLRLTLKALAKTKISTNKEFSCFKSLRCCINHANKCLNANNCEQDKFRAQLS